MAIIKIGKIKVTPERAISYAVSDKKEIPKKDDVDDSVKYVSRDKKDGMNIHKTISTPMYCSIDNAAKEWEAIRINYGKDDKILMFHVKQNFGLELDPLIANEIGCKLANELFNDYQCIVSTHTNTPYTHNHIIFNSVSFKNGFKYYDTLDSYKKMRGVSDRLCKEYGLPVLESTKDFKLVKVVGDDGKVKFYEPTERKSKIRMGKFANDNDYRNTSAYDSREIYKKTNREVIKSDIDKVLPTVNSYDELLVSLKNIGYRIKSKKVNGEWFVHISFKAPLQEKFTRDYKIGEEYTREKLSIIIEQNSQNIKGDVVVDTEFNIIDNNTDIDKYTRKIIDDINEDYRKKKSNNGKDYENVRRSEVEKIIIIDTKNMNKELDREYWDSIKFYREKSEPTLKNKRNQYLLDCINSNLKTLNFIENRNIQSFKQINSIVSVLYEKRNMVQAELDKIRSLLKKANESVVLINNYDTLKNQIDTHQGDDDFKIFELDSDKSLLNSYEIMLKNRNLTDPIQQEKFKSMFEKYNFAFEKLSNSLQKINEQIKEYDDCVYTINRVDKDSKQQYADQVKIYYENKEEQIRTKKQNKNHEDR